uniref:TBK1 binding protein 1 n=1 Tax=Scleropages formosus TaxID=113540 RepID=A0A8C9VZ52_SCLFO
MESLFGGDLGLLAGGEGLKEDGCGVGWSSAPLPDDIYSASHFALITAYHDIKSRLAGLERENSSIKRKLKMYEIKVMMERPSAEGWLCVRVCVVGVGGLQKSKEREEQLEDVIQAYEKIHMEKSNLQRDLDKMVSDDAPLLKAFEGLQCIRFPSSLQTHAVFLPLSDVYGEGVCLLAVLDCPALTLQSSRSLDTLSDLKLQRLEAELEGARHEAQGACRREEELKAECERLQEELRQLQEIPAPCERCNMVWIKKAGDEQVNLALAYTELSEELSRLRALSSKQSEILRKASQEQASPGGPHHSPIPHQRHSPIPQRHSPIPQRHSPVPQRRSPVLQRLSPDIHRRSPHAEPSDGPASYSCRPTSHHLRASFQGRRSYSEVADPSAYQRPPRFTLDPVSTLPKPRPYAEELPFPLTEVPHLRFEPPPSSEDEEEWACAHSTSPPRTLGSPGAAAIAIRGPASCSTFPIPTGPNTLSCHPPGYLHADHAQSWPSINLWMETEENDIRSCPLCQLVFPIGYPDDALIKHIDTHLENSKI